jgi:hypothetical protein
MNIALTKEMIFGRIFNAVRDLSRQWLRARNLLTNGRSAAKSGMGCLAHYQALVM